MTDSKITRNVAVGFIRLALAAAFLSAVADRFGLWGLPGATNVAWGGWGPFLDYVALLNPFVPQALIPLLGGIATAAEAGLAVGLLVGWKLRWFALGSGLLLMVFAVAMTATMGIKSALDYSVLSAAGAAFALAAISKKTRNPLMEENFKPILLLLFLSVAVVGISSVALVNARAIASENLTTNPQETLGKAIK